MHICTFLCVKCCVLVGTAACKCYGVLAAGENRSFKSMSTSGTGRWKQIEFSTTDLKIILVVGFNKWLGINH